MTEKEMYILEMMLFLNLFLMIPGTKRMDWLFASSWGFMVLSG